MIRDWVLAWVSRRRIVRRVTERMDEAKRRISLGPNNFRHRNRTHIASHTDCTKETYHFARCDVAGCGWRGPSHKNREAAIADGGFHSGRDHWF